MLWSGRWKAGSEEYLIVDGRQLAGAGAHSDSAGHATGGADDAVWFNKG
jgi:formate dehydrogenase